MTTKSAADLLFEDAVKDAITKGYWHQTPMAGEIAKRGLESLEKQDEATSEAEKPSWPHWANWCLVLQDEGDNGTVIYFTRKPTYAEKKAYCAIAGISPTEVEAVERI